VEILTGKSLKLLIVTIHSNSEFVGMLDGFREGSLVGVGVEGDEVGVAIGTSEGNEVGIIRG
jgi:hypothetical protein